MSFLMVGLGGALGAICRYLISMIPVKSEFPFLTLATNLLGAIAIGIIVGITEKDKDISPYFPMFFKTGFCGGFTTFSTFSLETFQLFDQSRYFLGGLYAALSLVLCLIGVFIGKMIVKR